MRLSVGSWISGRGGSGPTPVRGIKVFWTGKDGAVTVETDGDTLSVSTGKGTRTGTHSAIRGRFWLTPIRFAAKFSSLTG